MPVGLAVLGAAMLATGAPPADAAGKRCFGKKVNRVINANNQTVRAGFRDVIWVSGNNVTVIGKPYSRICAGAGRQIIRAGKGLSHSDGGSGNDKIVLHPEEQPECRSGRARQ